jgi:CDP-diacylglycerol--glycerol-3-phosphate 3-phosphatidyltransferase
VVSLGKRAKKETQMPTTNNRQNTPLQLLQKVPDALTWLRILLAPTLLYIAIKQGIGTAFVAVYALAAISDFFDGRLARWLGYTSRLGAILDSLADLFLYLNVSLGFCIAIPKAFAVCSLPATFYVATLAINWIVALRKFGRIPAYHTRLDKGVGYLLFFTVLFGAVSHNLVPFAGAIFLAGIGSIENICISIVSPRWSTEFKSLHSALTENLAQRES